MSEVAVKEEEKKTKSKFKPSVIRHASGSDRDSKFLYTNKKEPYRGKLYLRRDKDNAWEVLSEEKYNELPAKDKKSVGVEEIEFIRLWWSLSKHVESISMRPTLMGGMERDELAFLENRLKYYLKHCSFINLEFETDDSGFEHIKDSLWSEISGPNGISPEVLAGILRIFTAQSPI